MYHIYGEEANVICNNNVIIVLRLLHVTTHQESLLVKLLQISTKSRDAIG